MKPYAAVAIGAVLITWWIVVMRWDADVARINERHAIVIAEQATAASDAATAEIERANQRTEAVKREIENAKKQVVSASADANAANDVSERLLNERDALLKRPRSCPATPANGSQTEADLTALFAELFSSADKRAGDLAREADEARIAGLACERIYDGVRDK